MKPFKYRRPLKSGLDTVGPFHPYLAYAAVILLNLVGVMAIVAILVMIADLVENLF
jgi:hypothetical protein